jgi:hypothetical protein
VARVGRQTPHELGLERCILGAQVPQRDDAAVEVAPPRMRGGAGPAVGATGCDARCATSASSVASPACSRAGSSVPSRSSKRFSTPSQSSESSSIWSRKGRSGSSFAPTQPGATASIASITA